MLKVIWKGTRGTLAQPEYEYLIGVGRPVYTPVFTFGPLVVVKIDWSFV